MLEHLTVDEGQSGVLTYRPNDSELNEFGRQLAQHADETTRIERIADVMGSIRVPVKNIKLDPVVAAIKSSMCRCVKPFGGPVVKCEPCRTRRKAAVQVGTHVAKTAVLQKLVVGSRFFARATPSGPAAFSDCNYIEAMPDGNAYCRGGHRNGVRCRVNPAINDVYKNFYQETDVTTALSLRY